MDLVQGSQTFFDVFKYGLVILKKNFRKVFLRVLPLLGMVVLLNSMFSAPASFVAEVYDMLDGISFVGMAVLLNSIFSAPVSFMEEIYAMLDSIGFERFLRAIFFGSSMLVLLIASSIISFILSFFGIIVKQSFFWESTQKKYSILTLYMSSLKKGLGIIVQVIVLIVIYGVLYGASLLLRYLLTHLNLSTISGVPMVGAVMVLVWAGVSLSQMVTAYITGEAGIIDSFIVSQELVKHNWWYTVFAWIGIALIYGLLNKLVSSPLTKLFGYFIEYLPIWLSIFVSELISQLLFVLKAFILSSLSLSLYFNLKNRQQLKKGSSHIPENEVIGYSGNMA